MTMNGENVIQPAEQVPQEQVQPKPAETKPAEQPLNEERIKQLVEEATAKAVAAAKEIGRRELQSQQERNKAEMARIARRAQTAESVLGAARARIQSADPEVAKEMELAELRAKEQSHSVQEQEEIAARQQAEFHSQFQSGLTQYAVTLGIDPKDNRIDWGDGAPNYLVAQQRVLDSLAKIQKENTQSAQSALEKRLKDLETKVGKVTTEENIEANSVETTTSPGVVAGSDAEFLKKWGSGDLPYTKANEERFKRLNE